MINQVAPRTRISAEKMNKVITAVNTNTELLNKSNLTPVKALNGKAFAPEMFFNVTPSYAAFKSANPDFTLEGGKEQYTGAIMYTGGVDNILNMVTIDGKPLDYFYQTITTEEDTSLEELSANFKDTNNEFGPNVVIKGFHYNNNEELNTIKLGIGTTIIEDEVKNIAVIHVDNLPYEDPDEDVRQYLKTKEGTYFDIDSWYTIFTRDEYKNNLSADVVKPNQCYIGRLDIKSKNYMFLDAEKHFIGRDEESGEFKYCWKVYINNKLSDRSSAPYGFYIVFNGDIWEEHNIHGDWLILDKHPITTPLYCGFTIPEKPNGSKYKKIVFGTFSNLAPSASGSAESLPYYTQGSSLSGELYPDLVPILIADYDSDKDKVKQYFHGLLVDTFPIPDSRDPNWNGSVVDNYRGVGRSLDWVHIISSPWEQANLLELYNFSKESTFSGGKDCDEYEVTIKNDDGSDYETGSKNKTVLMRGDNSHELKYGKLVISKSALSSLINSVVDDYDDPYRPPVTEEEDGCTEADILHEEFFYVWNSCGESWEPLYGDGSVADSRYWKQGGSHGTNYGSTIGNSNKTEVIDLDTATIKGVNNSINLDTGQAVGRINCNGQITCNGIIVNNQDVVVTNGVLFIQTGAGNPLIVANGVTYGPKTIKDGDGNEVVVLAAQ